MQPYVRARTLVLLLLLSVGVAGCLGGQETVEVTQRPTPPPEPEREVEREPEVSPYLSPPYDTVRTGRFDTGKMWTFEAPPVDYFEEAYDFEPDSAWFADARLGALRFATYCSASFVSPNGLILTNHHCARESISAVSEDGEDLLDEGYAARSLDTERTVPELYVEQLIEMEDVTDRVEGAIEGIEDDETRAQVLRRTTERLEERMTSQAEERDEDLRVQVVELYEGARYSAYTFKRYGDVRLVAAPEEAVAYLGGDADNFTYPRYVLDYTLFRAYGEDDDPVRSEHFFEWHSEGSREGDAVFAVGNPGATSRLSTVSQLEFQRDYVLPQQLDVLERRAAILEEFIEEHPEEAEEYDLGNTLFSVRNSIKATRGQLEGLRDPILMARRAAAQRDLEEAIAQNDSLQERYGNLLDEIESLQRSKEAAAQQAGAFTGFENPAYSSHVLIRGLYAYLYSVNRQRAPAEWLENIREAALEIDDYPRGLEAELIAARLRELQQFLGQNDPTLRSILRGRSIEAVADTIAHHSALADSSAYTILFDDGRYMASDDPSVPVIEAFAPLYMTLGRQLNEIQSRERNLNAQLARARFAVFGSEAPPDASFSPRISDGVVRGYPYNGTWAPPYTTVFGMYNHHYTYGPESDWGLPASWIPAPDQFRLATPLNLVSTNDTAGGSSGSPLLNRDLKLVGLIFDSNVEALPNEYVYTDNRARAISVDVRAIQESLDDVYDLDRIVQELVRGELVVLEADADESIGEDK